jgi:propionyl-CoA synthetase
MFVAGERCDTATLDWAQKAFDIPVVDHWWQTETGQTFEKFISGIFSLKFLGAIALLLFLI